MKYVQLGQSDLRVSLIGVACVSFGAFKGRYPFAVPKDEALRILDHCYRSGINFYNTANRCSNGESEVILGQAIKKFNWRRENHVIATNVWFPGSRGTVNSGILTEDELDNAGHINHYGLSRKHIFDSLDGSLARLQLPHIDLLRIYGIDPQTPAEETIKALHDVVKSRKIRYIGASSMRTHQFLEYQYAARINGWTEFITMQSLHTAIHREEEREMLPAIAKSGMSISIKSMRATVRGFPFHGYPSMEVDKRINEKIEEITKARGVSMIAVVLVYSLTKPFTTALIVGLSKKKRVDEALKALQLHRGGDPEY
ncbi:NADP-dependent oxidoreductase domain-containing protein [Aspergillus venezuelensis]